MLHLYLLKPDRIVGKVVSVYGAVISAVTDLHSSEIFLNGMYLKETIILLYFVHKV